MRPVEGDQATSDNESMSSSLSCCASVDSPTASVSAAHSFQEIPLAPYVSTTAQRQPGACGSWSAAACDDVRTSWQAVGLAPDQLEGGETPAFPWSDVGSNHGAGATRLRAPRLALKRPAAISVALSEEPVKLLHNTAARDDATGQHQHWKRTCVEQLLPAEGCEAHLTGINGEVNFAPIIQAAIMRYDATSLSVDIHGPSLVMPQPPASSSSIQHRGELPPMPAQCSAAAASGSFPKPLCKPTPLDVPADWHSSKGSMRSVRRPLDLDSSLPPAPLLLLEGSGASNGSCSEEPHATGHRSISSSRRVPCVGGGGACPGHATGPDPRKVLDAWMHKMEELSRSSVWSAEMESSATAVPMDMHRGTSARRRAVPPPAFVALGMMGYELP